MELPAADASFDAAYEIEATCHAPDLRRCYAEIFRVLKPGGLFGSFEWALTDKYDAGNEAHRAHALAIQLGNGLPELRRCADCLQALKDVGFEVIEEEDLSKRADVAWYAPIDARRSPLTLENFRTTWVGRTVTRCMVFVLELLGIAPGGSSRVSRFLEQGADALVEGGRLGVFTPMYWALARKPLK